MPAQLDADYLAVRPWKAYPRLLSYALFEGRPATTAGRWINPLVFANYALQKRLPQPRRVVEPLFVIGMGRSGTTILGRVLSMHRDVGFLNEPKALWHSVHAGEDVIGNYTRRIGRYRLGAADATAKVRRDAHRLFAAYLAWTFSRRVVDKYPELVFRVPFVRAIFPDARFVLMVRNGPDTCASIEAWSRAHRRAARGGTEDWWGIDGRKWRLIRDELLAGDPELEELSRLAPRLERQVDMAAVEWIVAAREGLAAEAQSDGTILRVRYEDLTANPREELEKITQFAGLRYDKKMLDYGRHVLQHPAARRRIALHPGLQERFDEAMNLLGY